MPIHKFIRKPAVPANPPVAVLWYPAENLEYPAQRINNYKWKIFAQENLTIKPHDTKTIMLQFGVEMSIGVIIVSLDQEFKKIKCSIQNESVVESTSDIVISVCNNSDKDVIINKGDTLCHLTFINLN
jgi:dUTPase